MNSPCVPSSWRGLRSLLGTQLLGAQAILPACSGQSVLWLIVTAFLLTTSPRLFAQTNDGAGAARGQGADASGAVLTGASVTPGNLATGLERVVTTDANGNFAFAASNGARRRLIVRAVGFAPISPDVNPVSAPPVN
jgi:Carboxypeptidase regulatory-like domain